MFYKHYLILHSQLLEYHRAFFSVEGCDFTVDQEKDYWIVSYHMRDTSPDSFVEHFSTRTFRWESEGASLELQDGSLYLIQKIKPLHSYILFKRFLKDFLEQITLWKGILRPCLQNRLGIAF